jgi:hypothetical protein
MVWLVWIGKEGLCLLGAFPWGGGSSVDERGVLFLRILFLLNGRRGGRFRGGIFGGGEVVGGWVCKEANVRHLGKKKKKVSKGGA